jgi:hypothetical protein
MLFMCDTYVAAGVYFRFDAYSVWCGQRRQAACTTYSRLSMSPSFHLLQCVGDIRAIVNVTDLRLVEDQILLAK